MRFDPNLTDDKFRFNANMTCFRWNLAVRRRSLILIVGAEVKNQGGMAGK
jgi:hypothetical protein